MALNLPAVLSTAKDSDSIFMVELYVLYLKSGNLYLCAADQNVTYDGQQYLAVPMKRDKYTANSDSKVDDCKLSIDNVDDRFTAALFGGTDFRGCICDIFQIMYPEALDDPTQVKPIMRGYLDAPILNCGKATFEVEVKSQVPNTTNCRTFKLSCNAEFADQDSCMASLGTMTGAVKSGSTPYKILIQQSYASDYWKNGIITIGYESRIVESSVGNVINLRYPFTVDLTNYRIQRNCDKSWSDCGRIGQQQKYSGFIGIPYELVVRSS